MQRILKIVQIDKLCATHTLRSAIPHFIEWNRNCIFVESVPKCRWSMKDMLWAVTGSACDPLK